MYWNSVTPIFHIPNKGEGKENKKKQKIGKGDKKMKLTKKKIVATAVATSLVAILSMGTLAWFNATDSIENEFHVATSDQDTDPTFSVDVSETTGQEYWDVLPGDAIAKDPKVTNTGDYTQWIRVTVTLDNAIAWSLNGGSLVFTELFEGSTYAEIGSVNTVDTKWLLVDNDAIITEGNAVWYLYLNREFAPGSDEVLFTTVNIPEDFTLDEMKELNNGNFNITVKADALQRDNTGDNAVDAFDNVGWEAGKAFVDED